MLTRRAMLLTLPLLACRATMIAELSDAIRIERDVVHLDLTRIPELATAPGFLHLPQASIIVLRLATEFRAFSSICTHAGCAVGTFTLGRMRCPCHLSEFDIDGTPVAGPAADPLTRLRVTHAGETLTIARVA